MTPSTMKIVVQTATIPLATSTDKGFRFFYEQKHDNSEIA